MNIVKNLLKFTKTTIMCLLASIIFTQHGYANYDLAFYGWNTQELEVVDKTDGLASNVTSIVFKDGETEKDLEVKNITSFNIRVKETYFSDDLIQNNFDEAVGVEVSEKCENLEGNESCKIKIKAGLDAKSAGPVPFNIVYDAEDQKGKVLTINVDVLYEDAYYVAVVLDQSIADVYNKAVSVEIPSEVAEKGFKDLPDAKRSLINGSVRGIIRGMGSLVGSVYLETLFIIPEAAVDNYLPHAKSDLGWKIDSYVNEIYRRFPKGFVVALFKCFPAGAASFNPAVYLFCVFINANNAAAFGVLGQLAKDVWYSIFGDEASAGFISGLVRSEGDVQKTIAKKLKKGIKAEVKGMMNGEKNKKANKSPNVSVGDLASLKAAA